MADVVIFDENSIPQKVLRYIKSVNTPDYMGRTDVVIFGKNNPPNQSELQLLVGVDQRYWKHDAGSIVEMTPAEKAGLNNEIRAKATSDLRRAAEDIVDSPQAEGKAFRAFMLEVLDGFNRIHTKMGDPTITKNQFTTDIKNRIQSGDAD